VDRPARSALETLDEAPDRPDPVLEGEPRVPFAPRTGVRRPDVAGLDPNRARPVRMAVEPARRQERVKEREPKGRVDGRRPEIGLDPVEDRLEARELTRRVEIEQAIFFRVGSIELC
jgi:hypothetical protein